MRLLSKHAVLAASVLLTAEVQADTSEQHTFAHISSPEHYQALLENDQVRVLKMVLKPGETDNWHYHNDETVYFQSGSKLLIRSGDGHAQQVSVPDGHVMWHSAWHHQVSNVGDKTAIAIIVESKTESSTDNPH